MKKRKFLVPLAVSVAGLALPAAADTNVSPSPEVVFEALTVQGTIADDFIIERSEVRGAQMTYHQSHYSSY